MDTTSCSTQAGDMEEKQPGAGRQRDGVGGIYNIQSIGLSSACKESRAKSRDSRTTILHPVLSQFMLFENGWREVMHPFTILPLYNR